MEENNREEPVREEPAPRADNVGLLAWRLMGGADGAPPDFTAAPPLFDALVEEGDIQMAIRVRQEVIQLLGAVDVQRMNNPRFRANALDDLRNALFAVVQPLLYDLASAANVLAGYVAELAKPAESRAGRMELDTVRVRVEADAAVGLRIPLDDGRTGIVLSLPGADGFADVMPVAEETYGEDAGYPPTMAPPSGMWTSRQARMRRIVSSASGPRPG